MFFTDTLYGSHELSILVKLFLGALAGAIIGLEREKHGRPAGLRTHLLVALGACLMMVTSEAFQLKYASYDVQSVLRLDPARIAAQIIVGIGFLGAGVIIKEGISIRGLTTAASLWLVAGIGMAFGMGLILPGLMATALALLSLNFLKKIEPVIKKDRYLKIVVTASNRSELLDELEQLFSSHQLLIRNVQSSLDLRREEATYEFVLTKHNRPIGRDITLAISKLEGIYKIRYH